MNEYLIANTEYLNKKQNKYQMLTTTTNYSYE